MKIFRDGKLIEATKENSVFYTILEKVKKEQSDLKEDKEE